MYKTFLATVFSASLAGCAASPPCGNFIQDSTIIQNQAIATDAVAQLVKLHLPARTRLDMQQDTPDAFGIALVENLHAQGYAVRTTSWLAYVPRDPHRWPPIAYSSLSRTKRRRGCRQRMGTKGVGHE